MLFNSAQFLIFFPVVTLIYFLLPHRYRWFHLLIASCIFYMAFVPVYIFILLFTIIIDYVAGIMIENAEGRRRRLFLMLSIFANVGVLALFKYYNFFIDNMNALLLLMHITRYQASLLNILLPIGLSFHTFQAMSYTIEVYRANQRAERHFGIYALYVMFYPQLVAGPIERPQNLLHQFKEEHHFNSENLLNGLRQMLWGFFKKVVIADRLALYVNSVFSAPNDYHFLNLIIGTVFFTFQIYCDFSGYSDIAIGAAQTMGFDLMTNFRRPFQSKKITELWQRWHISLTTWFTDYIYTPFVTAKRDWGTIALYTGVMMTFLISGLWHGAAWKFVVFGGLNGIAIVYEMRTKKIRKRISKVLPSQIYNPISIVLTFCYFSLCEVFFRAGNISSAFLMIKNIVTLSRHNPFQLQLVTEINKGAFVNMNLAISCLLIILMLILESRISADMKEMSNKPVWDVIFCASVLSMIILLGVFTSTSFIYFQF